MAWGWPWSSPCEKEAQRLPTPWAGSGPTAFSIWGKRGWQWTSWGRRTGWHGKDRPTKGVNAQPVALGNGAAPLGHPGRCGEEEP